MFVIIKKYYVIDILINNVGIVYIGNIENIIELDLDRFYNINVKGVYNCMYVVIVSMKEK